MSRDVRPRGDFRKNEHKEPFYRMLMPGRSCSGSGLRRLLGWPRGVLFFVSCVILIVFVSTISPFESLTTGWPGVSKG